MQITVIDVGQPNTHSTKNGRSYQSMEVTYKNDSGQVQSKKLMSFSNPDVFKQAKDWQKGDTVDVNTQKDDNGYWQWISIGADAIAQATSNTSNTTSKTTRVTGSNYETKEERAQRQVMIVRQSSISSSISALTAEGKRPSVAEVLAMAKEFENYVMDNKSVDSVADMEDDIPL
jgi:hypothetical protein